MLSLSCIFSSCSQDSENAEITVDYIPVQFEKEGNWSLMSKDGEIKFKNAFINEPTQVIKSLFSVKEGDGFSLYRVENDKFRLVNGLHNLTYVGEPNCGLIPICRAGERISVVNLDGVRQFDLFPVNGKEIVSCNTCFDDDMLSVIDEENKYGFFNKKGKCIIPPVYDMVAPFSDGKAVVLKDSIWSVIDKTGKTLFTLNNKQIPMVDSKYKYGKLCTTDEEKHHFYVYNNKGDATKLSDKIFALEDFNGKYIIFQDIESRSHINSPEETKGLMTFDGKIILSPCYQSLIFVEDDKIIASKDGRDWNILSLSGKVYSEIDYNKVSYINGFGYVAKEYKFEGGNDNLFILNNHGEPIKDSPQIINVGKRLWSGDAVSKYIPTDRIVKAVTEIDKSGIGRFTFDNSKKDIANAVGVPAQRLKIQIDSINIGSSLIREYAFGFNEEIEQFIISIETPVKWGNQGVRDLVKGFTAKGFHETEHRDHGSSGTMSHMIKNGISIFIRFNDEDYPHFDDEEPQKQINLFIRKNLSKKDITLWLNEFEWMYDVEIEPQN